MLALLHDEPGADRVADPLPGAVLSAVNLCEVVGKLVEHGVPEAIARGTLADLGITVVPFEEDLAYRAALLRPHVSHWPNAWARRL